jgi:hypothetical protein
MCKFDNYKGKINNKISFYKENNLIETKAFGFTHSYGVKSQKRKKEGK